MTSKRKHKHNQPCSCCNEEEQAYNAQVERRIASSQYLMLKNGYLQHGETIHGDQALILCDDYETAKVYADRAGLTPARIGTINNGKNDTVHWHVLIARHLGADGILMYGLQDGRPVGQYVPFCMLEIGPSIC
jgi:hypothetical protein